MSTPSPAARWLGRTQPERFEVMTRWSTYVVFTLLPLMALSLVAGDTPWGGGAWPMLYVALMVLQAVLAVRVFIPSMRVYSNRARWPTARLRWLAASTVVSLVVAAFGYPGRTAALGFGLLLPLAGVVMAVAPIPARMRTLVGLSIGSGVLTAGLRLALGGEAWSIVPTLIVSGLSVTAIAVSLRLSVWMMAVVWELDDARQTAARLAVAEERLRFSRDLHDTFGRVLSTVAVKSELAAALAEQGDSRGPAEMLEVQRLAHDALREVRAIAQGYRAANLPTEIAGARELLRSAGVECRVAGESTVLPEPVAEAVAWVVREAVTNVVRHADATTCEIDVQLDGSVCRVRVTNDGAASQAASASGGNGLRGLRERLDARGGTLEVSGSEGVFVVEATVQVDSGGST